MRQSNLFGRTIKDIPKSITMRSHKLLYQGGFIRESRAGRYYFLPLGRRVQLKIIKVIRDFMNKAGAQELITPVLHPIDLWQETNRTNSVGFELMTVKDRRGAEFALGGTAEEMIVDLVRQFQLSYKDLPFNLYQFSTKFRDELRARGGLLRVREFIMKDAYSFHKDEECFLQEYKKMWDLYIQIFKTLGLETLPVLSDNGYIGGEYCHEFVVESEIGESEFFMTEDKSYIAHIDVACFDRQEMNPDEEIKPLEYIEQPEWVKTMEDNEKHYKQPTWRFLKNVVYKNRISGEIIIVVIRGDLEVNKAKVEKKLNMVGLLEEANEEDLRKIGTKPGYVHSWGHKGVKYIGDLSLKTVKNFIGGQKTETTDTINVNYGRDFECEILDDFAKAREGDKKDGKVLLKKKGIEVGNIFQLGEYYSSKMNATFIDEQGKNRFYYMGCYGIGIGRTLATIVEKHNDEKGIIWPDIIAPYKIHLITIGKDKEIINTAENLYKKMLELNLEVLYDDRDESPGRKLFDSDLIGIPYRIIISKKNLKNNVFEVKRRDSDKIEYIKKDQILNKFK